MSTESTNPLLDAAELPRFSAIRAEHAEPAVSEAIDAARAVLARVREAKGAGYADLLEPLELADERISRVFSPVSHLNSVRSTPEMREAYQNC